MRSFLALILWFSGAIAGLAQELPVLLATELDQLREKAGQEVVVEGDVVSVGKTANGSLTFINVGLPKKMGFVALVRQSSYRAFPEGFDGFKGQKVRLRGVITIYRENQPQIEVQSPDQISIVNPS
ncbi:MAG TPA: hypothetical protein VIS74_06145 [Chthoniobacterales bacterium]